MAAYAGLVSIMHIIEQLQVHPTPPISLDKKQVESLIEKVTFLQKFLEDYLNDGSQEAYELESRIRDAAHAVEDVIETEIVDRIHGGTQNRTTSSFDFALAAKDQIQGGFFPSTSHGDQYRMSSFDFHQRLEEVIVNMDPIMQEVMEKIKAKNEVKDQHLMHTTFNPNVGSSILPPPSAREDTMVGFDDVLFEIMDKLTRKQSKRQIIPIVGMGGIGKTTLARNIYLNPTIVQYFDICVWVTISHDYSVRKILLEALWCLSNVRENLSSMSEEMLAEKFYKSLSAMSDDMVAQKLYQSLSGRRYLIVMDDVWSLDVWDKLRFYFPDNNNGSGIIITTRLSKLASRLTGSHGLIEMNLLDDDTSWILFSKKAFGEEDRCPPGLEDIAKKIASRCKGLPLSIAVIGGLLAKSERTPQYLEHIAENLSGIANSEDDERCLKLLSMSYINLPVHLKPCFLYMGVFSEDERIRVSRLTRLWVAEGYLKPISGKCLEEVARDYVNDLMDRNLILPCNPGCSGRIKFCKIHDLLRDLCLREAQKEKFLCVTREDSPDINTQRRIVVPPGTSDQGRLLHNLQSTSLARSFKCYFLGDIPPLTCRLLRVLEENAGEMPEGVNPMNKDTFFHLVNLRYIDFICFSDYGSMPISPSPLALFWNLHTLIIRDFHWEFIGIEIWGMPLLRHLESADDPDCEIYIPDPPRVIGEDSKKPIFVLRFLRKLFGIVNFRCDEDVVSRIPNIKKLKLFYNENGTVELRCFVNNLYRLCKLESLRCTFWRMSQTMSYVLKNLAFPHSLRKLILLGSGLEWEEMSSMAGSLPNLQVLRLYMNSCRGSRWNPVEGQFGSLKYLQIKHCSDLEEWNADATNFPCLEELDIDYFVKLKVVPLGIGDIPTLTSITMKNCSHSSLISAKDIVDEQEDQGNLDLKVYVLLNSKDDQSLRSLDKPNFQIVLS